MTERISSLNPVATNSLRSFADFQTLAQRAGNLSQQQEGVLLLAWQQRRDQGAVKQLVLAHLKLVAKVVRQHAGYGMAEEDLAQEGVLGLMKAIQKFDVRMKVRLATYALWWIQAEIREFIFANWRLVKLPGSEGKKLFFNYRKTRARLAQVEREAEQGEEGSEDEGQAGPGKGKQLALAMRTSEANVQVARQYFSQREASLETGGSGSEETGESGKELMVISGAGAEGNQGVRVARDYENFHERSPAENVEQQQQRRWMYQMIARLPEREKQVIEQRYPEEGGDGRTLKEISEAMGVSIERVSQLEKAGIKRIKDSLARGGALVLAKKGGKGRRTEYEREITSQGKLAPQG